MADIEDFEPPARECDGCTACCEGWLSAEALGKRFFPGQPCHWVSCSGCTVYEHRPPVCSDFQCAWKDNHFLPEWFKPTEANVICLWRRWKELEDCTPEDRGGIYLSISEMGKPIQTKHLTWLNTYVQSGLLNVKYEYEGRWHWMGTKDFIKWCAGNTVGGQRVKAEQAETDEHPPEV